MIKILHSLLPKTDDDLYLLSKCKTDINEFFSILAKIKKIDIDFFYMKYPIINIDLFNIFNIMEKDFENFSIILNSPIKNALANRLNKIYTCNKYLYEYNLDLYGQKSELVNIEEIKGDNIIYNLLDFCFMYSKKIVFDNKTFYIKTFDEYLLSKIFTHKKVLFICNNDILDSAIYKHISGICNIFFIYETIFIYYEYGILPCVYKNNQKIETMFRNNNFMNMDRSIINKKYPEYITFFEYLFPYIKNDIIPFPEDYTELRYMIDNLAIQNDIMKNLYLIIKNNDELIEHILNNNKYSLMTIKDLVMSGLICYKIKIGTNTNEKYSINNNIIKIENKYVLECSKNIKARYIYRFLLNEDWNTVKIKIPTIDILYIINKIIDDNNNIYSTIDKTKKIIDKKIYNIKEYFNFCIV